jgi:hypothetical protein
LRRRFHVLTLQMLWKKYGLVILLAAAIAIRTFASYPAAVETYYAQGLYPMITLVLRALLGWIPFSIGDILYGLAVLYLVRGLFRLIRRMFQRNINRQYLLQTGKRTAFVVVWVYIIFNLFWGLNYNRVGIAQQLDLKVTAYTADELAQVVNLTLDKINYLDTVAWDRRDSFRRKGFLFKQAVASYKQAEKRLPFLAYRAPSVKPSLYSYLGDYLGYSGYYNPFSGEAQVNTTVPLVLQPFTTTHEIGHQLGFAKENEANFAGFLAGRASGDAAVRYSVYFDMYIYALKNLAQKDSALARKLHQRLPELARKDLRELREFYKKYENPLEPVIHLLYGQYLKANEQPQGILSYDEVIAWVIAYYRKYGEI